MRIHCLENVDKALQFLKEQRVHLENMGSHDIVDGNHRLTLGLIWTIILRFQVRGLAEGFCLPLGCKRLAKLASRSRGARKTRLKWQLRVRCAGLCVTLSCPVGTAPTPPSVLLGPESLGSPLR